mmetsp:Transcript_20469/g.29386  ORF Transcript_20469/g.29386 Transcript_20469/m.29386 type:complete len:713 (-) Transcript_20469:55-2193(-)
MSTMELHTSVDDYCLQKVLGVAEYADIELNVTKGVSEDSLQQLHSQAKSFVLMTPGGPLTCQNTILRYLGELKPASGLVGETAYDSSQIDQWIDFSWQEIEVRLHVLLAKPGSPCLADVSPQQKAGIDAKVKGELPTALLVLDSHLESKTYIVSERITIADISLCCTCTTLHKMGLVSQGAYPNLFRWMMTVSNHKSLKKTFGPSDAGVKGQEQGRGQIYKWSRGRIRVKELLNEGKTAIGREVTVKGWIRTTRSAEKGKIVFVELTDGSTPRGLQLVLNSEKVAGTTAVANCGGAGASLSVKGLVVESPAKGQSIEVHVTDAEVLGPVYGGENGEVGGKLYPMAKKQHSLEFLREMAHLRPRSKVFSSALRMRHAMAYAVHSFYNERGFVYVHTPLITAADCEGAGEQFLVTTLLPHEDSKPSDIPTTPTGAADYSKDFFGRRCSLTVSGQLNVETHACALSDVYTFGPTFRAENSHTSRHLAEFWMIEPEICFADIFDNMALAEDFIKYCTRYALEHCADDLAYFEEQYPQGEKGLRERLRNVAESDFARISYTDAVHLLHSEIAAGKVTFENYPEWGGDLNSEHERYLSEKIYQRPTIVYNYPKGIKAFYMRLNEDNETVAAMDILVPKIGEIIGGSQREERLDVLERRCTESGLSPQDVWWYSDLRRYGSVPHSGFGLGFERLLMYVTGLENIRDVISFPRVPGKAEF